LPGAAVVDGAGVALVDGTTATVSSAPRFAESATYEAVGSAEVAACEGAPLGSVEPLEIALVVAGGAAGALGGGGVEHAAMAPASASPHATKAGRGRVRFPDIGAPELGGAWIVIAERAHGDR
jgi:hypothetical protein